MMEEENPRFHPEMTIDEIGSGLEEAQCEFWTKYHAYVGSYPRYETRHLSTARSAETAEVILDAFAKLGAVTAGDAMEMIKKLEAKHDE